MGTFCKYPNKEDLIYNEIYTLKGSNKNKKNLVFKAREYKCFIDNSSKIINLNIKNEIQSLTDKHSSNLKFLETGSNFDEVVVNTKETYKKDEKDDKDKKILINFSKTMNLKQMSIYKSSFISNNSTITPNTNSQIKVNRDLSKKCFEELRKYIKKEENNYKNDNNIYKIPYSSKLYLSICELIANPYNERSSQGITEYLSLQYNNQYSFKEFFFVGDDNPKKSLLEWVDCNKLLIKKYFLHKKIEFACCFTMKISENEENSRFSYEYSIFVGYLANENEYFSEATDNNYSSISI